MSDEVVVEQPSTPEPAGDKLDQIIHSAIDKVEAAEAPPVEAKETKPRDERGRFVSDTPAEAAPSPEPAPEAAKPEDPIKVEPAQQPLEPHPRWSAEDKARFVTLPREAQEFLLNREKATEGDYTRKTQALADRERSIEPLLAEVQRANPLLQQMGVSAHEFLAQSVNAVTNLRTGPAQQRAANIVYLADHNGIPREAIAQALGISTHGGEGQQIAQPDPQYSTLAQQVSSLSQALNQLQSQNALNERQRAEAEFNALAQAKDASGQLKFPHFERVKQSMIQLVANGQYDNWDTAYDKAVRLDDDLHKQIIEAAAKREREALEKERLEAVEKAKKAQPVKTSNSMPRGDVKQRGLDAHLESAFARVGGL